MSGAPWVTEAKGERRHLEERKLEVGSDRRVWFITGATKRCLARIKTSKSRHGLTGIELRSVSGRGANGMGGAPSDEEGWLRGERSPWTRGALDAARG
jgi:hypothetical protein